MSILFRGLRHSDSVNTSGNDSDDRSGGISTDSSVSVDGSFSVADSFLVNVEFVEFVEFHCFTHAGRSTDVVPIL